MTDSNETIEERARRFAAEGNWSECPACRAVGTVAAQPGSVAGMRCVGCGHAWDVEW